MNNDSKINKLILKSAYATIILLIIAVIALLILKYNVEGEKNMPFKLSSIIVISSAEGHQKEEKTDYLWDAEIYQINDIYLNLEKNNNYKETEIITSVKLENLEVSKVPKIGEIQFYKISNELNKFFLYSKEFEIKDSIEYIGDINTDLANLKISNQGGTLIIRAVNKTGKNYTSNDKALEHNGKLLNKVGILYEEIEAIISFDLVINLQSDLKFRTKIELNLPIGNIEETGFLSTQINDMKNIIFKREQI